MSLFPEDMNMNAVVPLVGNEVNKLDDERTANHGCQLEAAPLSSIGKDEGKASQSAIIASNMPRSEDSTTCEVDESAVNPVSNVESEHNQNTTYPVSDTMPITSLDEAVPSEVDETAMPIINNAVSAPNREDTPDTNTKTLVEQRLREQTEAARINFIEIAEDTDADEATQYFACTVAEIIEWWQHRAKDGNPATHPIDFGTGSPINLLMVLALLPEKHQALIPISDVRRSPSSNGQNLSWLHEQTTDVLIRLSTDPRLHSLQFGQGLASMVRDGVDESWRVITGNSWLEDQLHLLSTHALEPDLYNFPPQTKKLIFLFNPTEIHWTVVSIDRNDDSDIWTYTLYNSLSQGEKGPTWNACQEQLPLLERLICLASGFPEPASREIVMAESVQQVNAYDCGPIAVYNAVELLEGRKPSAEIDTEELRWRYLSLIRDALYVLDMGLETSAFRTYMRKVCLDYV